MSNFKPVRLSWGYLRQLVESIPTSMDDEFPTVLDMVGSVPVELCVLADEKNGKLVWPANEDQYVIRQHDSVGFWLPGDPEAIEMLHELHEEDLKDLQDCLISGEQIQPMRVLLDSEGNPLPMRTLDLYKLNPIFLLTGEEEDWVDHGFELTSLIDIGNSVDQLTEALPQVEGLSGLGDYYDSRDLKIAFTGNPFSDTPGPAPEADFPGIGQWTCPTCSGSKKIPLVSGNQGICPDCK